MADVGDADNAALELLRATGKLTGQLQLRLQQVLTSASPVNIGFFRGRWNPKTGKGITGGEKPPNVTRNAARASANAKAKENRAAAVRIAQTYNLRQGKVFITNPTIYGPQLAAGSSAQAKSGWIERAISTAIRSVGRTGL